MRKDMKKCPKPLGYGIRRTPVVLGLSAALCMPAAFSYANVGGRMDSESVQSVLQTHTVKGTIVDETGHLLVLRGMWCVSEGRKLSRHIQRRVNAGLLKM